MSDGRSIESFLARLYVDETLRRRFLDDPRKVAATEGFNLVTIERLVAIDREGLEMAASSFARKREGKHGAETKEPGSWFMRWFGA